MENDFDLLAHTAGLVKSAQDTWAPLLELESGVQRSMIPWTLPGVAPQYPATGQLAQQYSSPPQPGSWGATQDLTPEQLAQYHAMAQDYSGWTPQASTTPAATPGTSAASPPAGGGGGGGAVHPASQFGTWRPTGGGGGGGGSRGGQGGEPVRVPGRISDMFGENKNQAVNYLKEIHGGGNYDPIEAFRVLKYMWRHTGEQMGGKQVVDIGLTPGGGNADAEIVGNLVVDMLEKHPELANNEDFSGFLNKDVIPRFGTGEYSRGRGGHEWGYTVQRALQDAKTTLEAEPAPGADESATTDLGKWDLRNANDYRSMLADPNKAAQYFEAVAQGKAVFQQRAVGLIDAMYRSEGNNDNTYVPVVAAAMYRAMRENPALMADRGLQRQYERTRSALDAMEDKGYRGEKGDEAVTSAMSAINGFLPKDYQVPDRAAWRSYGDVSVDYANSIPGAGTNVWADNGAPIPVEESGAAVNITPRDYESESTGEEAGAPATAPGAPAAAEGPPVHEVAGGPETSTRRVVQRDIRHRMGQEGTTPQARQALEAVQEKLEPVEPTIQNLMANPKAIPTLPRTLPMGARPGMPAPEAAPEAPAPGAVSQQQVEQSQAGVSEAGAMGQQVAAQAPPPAPPPVSPAPAVPAPPPPPPTTAGTPPVAPALTPGVQAVGTTSAGGGMDQKSASLGALGGLASVITGRLPTMDKEAADLAVSGFAMMAKDLGDWATSDPGGVEKLAAQAALADPDMTRIAEAEMIGRLMANGQFARMLKAADAAPVVITQARATGKPFDARHDDVTQEGTPESAGMNRGSNRQAGTP